MKEYTKPTAKVIEPQTVDILTSSGGIDLPEIPIGNSGIDLPEIPLTKDTISSY